MPVDAAYFGLCKNPTNCLLSMNFRASYDVCSVQSVKHDKLDSPALIRVKTYIKLR